MYVKYGVQQADSEFKTSPDIIRLEKRLIERLIEYDNRWKIYAYHCDFGLKQLGPAALSTDGS